MVHATKTMGAFLSVNIEFTPCPQGFTGTMCDTVATGNTPFLVNNNQVDSSLTFQLAQPGEFP
jgi:hypothetical protein